MERPFFDSTGKEITDNDVIAVNYNGYCHYYHVLEGLAFLIQNPSWYNSPITLSHILDFKTGFVIVVGKFRDKLEWPNKEIQDKYSK